MATRALSVFSGRAGPALGAFGGGEPIGQRGREGRSVPGVGGAQLGAGPVRPGQRRRQQRITPYLLERGGTEGEALTEARVVALLERRRDRIELGEEGVRPRAMPPPARRDRPPRARSRAPDGRTTWTPARPASRAPRAAWPQGAGWKAWSRRRRAARPGGRPRRLGAARRAPVPSGSPVGRARAPTRPPTGGGSGPATSPGRAGGGEGGRRARSDHRGPAARRRRPSGRGPPSWCLRRSPGARTTARAARRAPEAGACRGAGWR